jgi:hypothetical protein
MISRAVKIAKRTSSSSSSNGGQHISITVEIFLQAILFLVVTNAMDSRYSFFVTLQVYFRFVSSVMSDLIVASLTHTHTYCNVILY